MILSILSFTRSILSASANAAIMSAAAESLRGSKCRRSIG
jgi:hypothetical protein